MNFEQFINSTKNKYNVIIFINSIEFAGNNNNLFQNLEKIIDKNGYVIVKMPRRINKDWG